MIAAASETRAVSVAPKLDTFGHPTLHCYSHSRRPSTDRDRELRTRRQSAEYMDLSGMKVDLNGMLANTFMVGQEQTQSTFQTPLTQSPQKDKGDRKLLPKNGGMKRRRRCTALHLLAEKELAKTKAS